METAFLALRIFPPPPSGTDILPGFHGPGTRSAADAGKPPVMKLVVRHFILTDIIPNLTRAPVSQRIDLDNVAEVPIDLDFGHPIACHCLLAPETRHPRVQAPQRPPEVLCLQNVAATRRH